MIDASVLVALIGFAGALAALAVGWIKDNSAAKRLRDELDRLEERDEHRNGYLMALRHYINVLVVWGAWSKDETPRKPPEPPDALMGDGKDD